MLPSLLDELAQSMSGVNITLLSSFRGVLLELDFQAHVWRVFDSTQKGAAVIALDSKQKGAAVIALDSDTEADDKDYDEGEEDDSTEDDGDLCREAFSATSNGGSSADTCRP